MTSTCTQLMCCVYLQVEKVSYPALASSPDHSLATKLFGGRGGGVLSFMITGSMAQTKSFLGVTPILSILFSCALRCIQRRLHCGIARQSCELAMIGHAVYKEVSKCVCILPQALVCFQVLAMNVHHLLDSYGLFSDDICCAALTSAICGSIAGRRGELGLPAGRDKSSCSGTRGPQGLPAVLTYCACRALASCMPCAAFVLRPALSTDIA